MESESPRNFLFTKHLMLAVILIFLAIPFFTSMAAAEDPPPFLLKWGEPGTGDMQFNLPFGVAVDSKGNVYVVDSNNYRIQKFNASGGYITQWGSQGSGDEQFFFPPYGVAVDSAGKNVYVVEWGTSHVHKFTSTGTFLFKWGSAGTGDGQFSTTYGVAVDSPGNVYVADTGNNRIQKFDSAGNFLAKWGSAAGTGDGQFDEPRGVTVDSAGNIYVADWFNSRIQKFDSAGNFLSKWGSYGTGDGQFETPAGVAVDSKGNVYVADTFNNRIQKFGAPGRINPRVRLPKNIQWTAEAILLDGINKRQKYSIPVKEAVTFISSNSRFKVRFSVEAFDIPHTYTFYDCPEGLQTCVVVNKWDIDPSIWESVPTQDFYMLLWDTAGNPALQAGGTWGVPEGVYIGGLNRPYITIPVDPLWYNNEPYQGFSSRAAQIMTHEIINAINAKLEVDPYNCSPLVADPGITDASDYEASRLSKLTDDCYLKYLDVSNLYVAPLDEWVGGIGGVWEEEVQ